MSLNIDIEHKKGGNSKWKQNGLVESAFLFKLAITSAICTDGPMKGRTVFKIYIYVSPCPSVPSPLPLPTFFLMPITMQHYQTITYSSILIPAVAPRKTGVVLCLSEGTFSLAPSRQASRGLDSSDGFSAYDVIPLPVNEINRNMTLTQSHRL